MEVLAVIPARSGSKSVKDKNIRLINKNQCWHILLNMVLRVNTLTV